MRTAIRDAAGTSLRPRMRVTAEDDVRYGSIVGLSPPFSVSVRWDDGEEETVRGDRLRVQSKLEPPRG